MRAGRLLAIAMVAIATAGENGAAQEAAPQGGAELTAQSQTRSARQSWTADRRAFDVGDVVTVLIDEQTLANATTGNFASDRRRRDLSVGATQTVTGSYPRVAGSVSSANDAESRQRGEAIRQNRFVGEITVRVVAVENGLLHVRGERRTRVDGSEQELSLAGWIRPEDITSNNLVESWRIGDAELVYSTSGDLGKPRGGILTRLLGWIWP